MSRAELPWYEDVGREPWPDAKVDEAIAAWSADHPDADEGTLRQVAFRSRRLNAEARTRAAEREEAERAGTTVEMLRQAKAERAAHARAQRDTGDLARARRAVSGPSLPRGVSQERLDRYARKAIALREPDGTWPTQESVAEALGITDRAVRDVGWELVLVRAKELAAEPGSGGTSG